MIRCGFLVPRHYKVYNMGWDDKILHVKVTLLKTPKNDSYIKDWVVNVTIYC